MNENKIIDIGEKLGEATTQMRRFLAVRRIVENDYQACTLIGLSTSQPTYWREHSPVFQELETALYEDFWETLWQTSEDNLLLAAAIQKNVMLDDNASWVHRLKGAHDSQEFYMRVAEIKAKQTKKPFTIKVDYDDGTKSLQPAQDTDDSASVESTEENPEVRETVG